MSNRNRNFYNPLHKVVGLTKRAGLGECKRLFTLGELEGFNKDGEPITHDIDGTGFIYSDKKPVGCSYYITETGVGYYIPKYARIIIKKTLDKRDK